MFGMNKDDGSVASAQAMGQMMDDPALLDSAASMMSAPTTSDPAITGNDPSVTPPLDTTAAPATDAPTTPAATASTPAPISDIVPPSAGTVKPWTPDNHTTDTQSTSTTDSTSSNTTKTEDTSTDEDKFSFSTPAPTPSTTTDSSESKEEEKTEEPTPEPDTPEPAPAIEDTPAASTPSASDSSMATGDLADIKEQALKALQPLVTKLEQTPEEEFRTLMMMIQASDDHTLIDKAYKAAQNITDEKAKAQALLDIVNEVNYFTQK